MRGLLYVLISCLALGVKAVDECRLPFTVTVTIPYLGPTTTSTTLTPCVGPPTVVVETPIATPVCPPRPTVTPGGACLSVKPCAPAGLNIDYYANAFAGYSSGSVPPSYYITEGLTPLQSSLTNETFFPQDYAPTNLPVVYPDPALPAARYWVGWTRITNGGVTVDANNFTLVYQGFYRAPATGTYQLCATADNEDAVYFGAGNAFSCSDGTAPADATPLFTSTGANFINGINCTNVDLVEGFYYPVRNVMGNWQGPSAFNFTIQAPGVSFEDRSNDFSGNAYPHDCGVFS